MTTVRWPSQEVSGRDNPTRATPVGVMVAWAGTA